MEKWFASPSGHSFPAYLLDLTYWWSSVFDHPITLLTAQSIGAGRCLG